MVQSSKLKGRRVELDGLVLEHSKMSYAVRHSVVTIGGPASFPARAMMA
jgi:hypothetical protein